MASTQYRGLTVFISDIRNCKTKEQEQLRVNRELANIRTKFTSKNGTNTSYKRKKYARCRHSSSSGAGVRTAGVGFR